MQGSVQVFVSDAFETFIMALILINIACLAVYHVGMPNALTITLFWLNVAFTIIFLFEAIVKLIGLGIKQYFQDRWCIFDFFVAILSVVQIIIDFLQTSDVPAVNLLRVFRVVRVFRLVPKVCCKSPYSHAAFQKLQSCQQHFNSDAVCAREMLNYPACTR
jgi:hypothetical protein